MRPGARGNGPTRLGADELGPWVSAEFVAVVGRTNVFSRHARAPLHAITRNELIRRAQNFFGWALDRHAGLT